MLLTEKTLEDIKRSAAYHLPKVPPTLRCEAIARGFGYTRWVTLRQQAQAPQEVNRPFSSELAEAFLVQRMGFCHFGVFRTIINGR